MATCERFYPRSVDDGESELGKYKKAPILVPDGVFEKDRIITMFCDYSTGMEKMTREFINETLKTY